jgi:sulfide:quinone oxidoreductase
MKDLVILGAGTAGTMVANHLRSKLPNGWQTTVIDPEPEHLYQPGLLFLPFGARDESKMIRRREKTLAPGVHWIEKRVEAIDIDARSVALAGHDPQHFDQLVIATGSRICPEETPGLVGEQWGKSIHDFYTLEGAQRLRDALATFEGGRLVVNIVEMPINCPVAPLEFLFLADDFFKKKGNRDQVELVYVTPLDGAFTKPACSDVLGYMLEEKGISLETEFNASEVDGDSRILRSYDEREVNYDLLVSIPTHMGAEVIEKSGLGDELGFVPTDNNTLQATGHDDIFVLGDAANVPTSKAGSVAHFQSEVVADNVMRSIRGQELHKGSDGHANCFIESGDGKALLIDFNYYTEPLPGHYPLPAVGPFKLLGESRLNHMGKLSFRWIYWNALLPARPMPISNRMSMVGKRSIKVPDEPEAPKRNHEKAA